MIEPDFEQERFLTEDPNESFRHGRFTKIPVIAGITVEEFVDKTVGNYFFSRFESNKKSTFQSFRYNV